MENVIIVGSGPAGLTAAIYAARANLKPLCIEGVVVGGQTGGQLMPFRIEADTKVHEARSLIVSTGASARWLGLASEKALMNRCVSACATCDGYFFRGHVRRGHGYSDCHRSRKRRHARTANDQDAGPIYRDRSRAQHAAIPWPVDTRRERMPEDRARHGDDQHCQSIRVWGRARPCLPSSRWLELLRLG